MSAAPQFAFATLVTTDEYLPGALVVAAALRDIHLSPPNLPGELEPSEFHVVCLVTPESVDVTTVKHLRKAFDVVIGVELIEAETQDGLKLLGRPDLNTVLTKLHVFRLTSYEKIIFLDADILPLRPVSHLFRISADFAAVPDVGWPDIFNSGFLVLTPGVDKFNEILSLVNSKGSWDGGDQGVLNEWRGNDWERLSFTYNTMPTAIYTYAPAYKRFGSQISNIHFIGPNKPWKQIPLRAFTSHPSPTFTSEADQNDVSSSLYAYSTLLDRWSAVYDKHYRSLSISGVSGPATAPSAFPTIGPIGTSITRQYQSVWDSSTRSEVRTGVSAENAPLGLEELRRVAVEGVGESKVTEDQGVYRSMPLEGRIDLMRPAKHASTVPEELVVAVTEKPTQPMIVIQVPSDPHTPIRSNSPAPMTTLPTPGPHELPPAPLFRGHSLPPETPTHAPRAQSTQSPVSPLRGKWPFRPASEHPPRSPSPVHHSRPVSPPLVSWNPAVEAPPNIPPLGSHFPEQMYFQNVWDVPAKVERAPPGGGLFPLPPHPNIPEQLIREGHYKFVIGEALQKDQRRHTPPEERPTTPSPERRQPYHDGHQDPPSHPQPDRSKIVSVFPWEEKPRHAPERFFPRTDSPPPGHPFVQPQPLALRLDLHLPHIPPTVSPPQAHDFSRTTRYANVWDEIPSIQRYASQLAGPAPASTPLAPQGSARGGRTHKGSAATSPAANYRSWQDQVEVSSRDADDEYEGDEEDVELSLPIVAASGRPGELSLKKYKMKGVQTVPRQLMDREVQVPNGGPAVQSDPRQDRDVEKEEQEKRGSPPASGRELLPDVKKLEGLATTGPVMGAPLHKQQALEDHQRALSPNHREADPIGPAISSHDKVSAIPELSSEPPTEVASAQEHTVSQPSLSEASTSEGTPAFQSSYPHATTFRPVRRTFDPARGVDVFKKGSEEVLARFLKIGWRDENSSPGQSLPSAI